MTDKDDGCRPKEKERRTSRKQGRRDEASASEKARNTDPFSIASAEASSLHGEFCLSRRNADEVSWNQLSTEDRTQFLKAIETEWQGVLDFKAVTIIDPTQADVIREKQRERVISSRLVLRWKETDRHRIQRRRLDGAYTVSRILISTILSAAVQRQSCRPSTLHFRS